MKKSIFGLLVILSMIAVACGGGSLEGEEVFITGALVGNDAAGFQENFDSFQEETGIIVSFQGSDNFEQEIQIQMESGDTPDIALFPQPGGVVDAAQRGYLISLEDLGVDMDEYRASFSSYIVGLGEVDGAHYGGAHAFNLKSIVWYQPAEFEARGYSVPATWDEMIALADQIVAEGMNPFCFGMESEGASGWLATDWMEDIMLRTTSAENYDRWVSNDLAFNSPEVINAMELYGKFSRNDDYVAGGAASVATTSFGDAPKGLFTSPPSCMMHRQASFITGFFPDKGEEVARGEADAFYFPPFASGNLGNPVLGAGTLYTMAKDSPATRGFFKYLQEASAHEAWMQQGVFLTAHKGTDLSAYATPLLRKQGEILANATTFRFDASDLMPGAIGAGAFWSEMTAFANGQDANKTADNIQSAWDAIK